MDKIKKYVERFFKDKPGDRNYSLTVDEMVAFMEEVQYADGDGLFRAIVSLFNYGYAKGYRACKAEMKKKAKETA